VKKGATAALFAAVLMPAEYGTAANGATVASCYIMIDNYEALH
jgi:hypothetical protein